MLSTIAPIGGKEGSQNALFSSKASARESGRDMFTVQKEGKVVALIEQICSTLNIKHDGSNMSKQEMSDRADNWAFAGEEVLTSGGGENMDSRFFAEVEEYFKLHEQKESKIENNRQFEKIEVFIENEKHTGRKRREAARLLAASEEVRVAAEVAELKAYRLKQVTSSGDQKLQEKISDAEKSYAKRKMVISKAARLATSDCRKQFKRVRDFFQSLHDDRRVKLRQQYDRSLKVQSVLHRLRKLDPRVMALEQQTAERIFRKKESDMTELNMIQNLEEATYLEKIISLLDEVQTAKENSADAYFTLQIKNLKIQQRNQKIREKEVTDMKAKNMLEMSDLIAKYVKEEMQDREEEEETKVLVERTERKKDFEGSNSKVLLSVSDLYDTILWSVATGSIGISSSDSDSFVSYWSDDEGEDDEDNNNKKVAQGKQPAKQRSGEDNDSLEDDLAGVDPARGEQTSAGSVAIVSDGDNASVQSGSTANTTDVNTSDSLSPVGHIFVKELRRKIRAKEKKVEKRHLVERKLERKQFRAETRKLKEQHQAFVDDLLVRCADERVRLRGAIARRMAQVEQEQDFSTQTLQEAVEADVKAMQGAWSEHKRLEEEQKTAFAKAQALVSAQVFHEVRNALSSVVAMSEMTSSLQKDPAVNSETLVASVSEMLDQNKEVVNYSLNMLNNILDVSKIKAGSFETQKGFFDLQDLVNRSTTMQLVKAQTRGVKMSFSPLPQPQIAYSDEDIVVRIITNFISNAVKFTAAGAVQPFVCPLEDINPNIDGTKHKSISIEAKKTVPGKKSGKKNQDKEEKQAAEEDPMVMDVKYVAVGVADTGPGLSTELLKISKAGLFNSDASKMNSGAKNSGFGLHLAHQLAGTLGSEVNLTDLESFRKFYNVDMASVLNGDTLSVHSSSDAGSVYSEESPGKGTVLYITIPVVANSKNALTMLDSAPGSSPAPLVSSKKYIFAPKPSPNSVDGCFRILVADDVTMLRKGLMRSVLDIFKQHLNCPISVSTACTAEDALRAIKSNSYDMFICDNQFAPPTHLKKLPPEREKNRFQVDSRGSMTDIRNSVMHFFKNESFTIAPGDGSLSGIDALLELAQDKSDNPSSPASSIPILVLHSGHELELPRQLGIIVVRKPLKRLDFVPLFERNAQNLIDTGMCVETQQGDGVVVLTRGGAQLFTKRKFVEKKKQQDSDATDENQSSSSSNSSAQLGRKRDAEVEDDAVMDSSDEGLPQQSKKQKSDTSEQQM